MCGDHKTPIPNISWAVGVLAIQGFKVCRYPRTVLLIRLYCDFPEMLALYLFVSVRVVATLSHSNPLHLQPFIPKNDYSLAISPTLCFSLSLEQMFGILVMWRMIKAAWYSESESASVMSDSLQPHWLYSPWNSLGQNTGVASLSLLQGIFPTQGLNPVLPHCRQILYQLSHKGSPLLTQYQSDLGLHSSSSSYWTNNSVALRVSFLPCYIGGQEFS